MNCSDSSLNNIIVIIIFYPSVLYFSMFCQIFRKYIISAKYDKIERIKQNFT